MMRFLTKVSVLVIATGILLPAQQTVWFTPLPYGSQPVGLFGSTDYQSLFSPGAPWQQATSHVQVFKIYGVTNFSDSNLLSMFAYLKAHNIALALEWPVLSATTCGNGIEGFGSNILPTLQRIQGLGGTLGYLAMQQPFEWGSLYTGANACHFTAQQVAANALVTVNQAKTVFPNLLVGDITAVPSFDNFDSSWVPLYASWFDAWRSASGVPLAFFHVDVNWTVPNWQAAVAAIRPSLEQRGIPFGIVYNGFLTDETDAAWMADAESHFIDFEVNSGYAPPEQVNFQSWNPNPIHVLPETDPTAFTYLIDYYFRTRTNLTLTNNGAQLSGKLTSGGSGVAGASVQLTSQPLSGSGTIATYTISGLVPNEAVTAILGARINSECYACNGATDVTVYTFQYKDTQNSTGILDFSSGLNGWSFGPGSPVFTRGPSPYVQGLHITAQPGQALGLNSTPIVVTGGLQFTFQVAAQVSPLSVGSGYFTVIWLDSAGNEPSREYIMFEPATQTLTTATTAADGSYSASMPVDPTMFQVTAQYAGSATQWPSLAAVPASTAPSSPPAIVSLTPNAAAGTSVSYSVVFSDPGGWTAIANAQVLVNSTLSQQAGCSISYLPTTGTFQLLSDSGTWSNTALSNSECSLSGASASGTGNNLTLTFTLNFTTSFGSTSPLKTIFLQATDAQGLVVPWVAEGTALLISGACTQHGSTSVTDVQSIVNQALGVTLATSDMNSDGVVNVVDVQTLIDAYGCGSPGSPALIGSGIKTMGRPAGKLKLP